MRLDKFLAHHLGISRSLVNKELKAGLVTVNDQIVKVGAYQLAIDENVSYRGNEIIPVIEKRYFM
ncbi:MAG: hypothetical protein J6562_04345, partial [Candidatus Schmidhempelia sp.]|nr:hypothetical protein [Candidatus Schmidhempelia sp.]